MNEIFNIAYTITTNIRNSLLLKQLLWPYSSVDTHNFVGSYFQTRMLFHIQYPIFGIYIVSISFFVHVTTRHNDLPWNVRKFMHNKLHAFNFTAQLNKMRPWSRSAWSHTDLPRIKKGLVGAQVRRSPVKMYETPS